MPATPSTMPGLGTPAPDFALPDPAGQIHTLADFADAKALLIVVMCNHCPYVVHLADKLAELARDYQQKGVAVVGVNANDIDKHPDDSPEKMAEESKKRGYTFPYVHDASQQLAKTLGAACTPDFFLCDADRRLAYRGQFDDTRPDQGAPTGADLTAAVDALLAGQPVPADQKPSLGCNVKWKPGNEPAYA
ncbi:MAG: thioredoxin family protein [Planctomycetaceae bacterium]|nr:thioredoxin family protein [Planctomycetaceae bacterium]